MRVDKLKQAIATSNHVKPYDHPRIQSKRIWKIPSRACTEDRPGPDNDQPAARFLEQTSRTNFLARLNLARPIDLSRL